MRLRTSNQRPELTLFVFLNPFLVFEKSLQIFWGGDRGKNAMDGDFKTSLTLQLVLRSEAVCL